MKIMTLLYGSEVIENIHKLIHTQHVYMDSCNKTVAIISFYGDDIGKDRTEARAYLVFILFVPRYRVSSSSSGTSINKVHISRLMKKKTQKTKWHVHPAKTQISLGIYQV